MNSVYEVRLPPLPEVLSGVSGLASMNLNLQLSKEIKRLVFIKTPFFSVPKNGCIKFSDKKTQSNLPSKPPKQLPQTPLHGTPQTMRPQCRAPQQLQLLGAGLTYLNPWFSLPKFNSEVTPEK